MVNNIINYGVFLAQVSMSFIATFLLYMVFAVFDYKGGMPEFVGLALFQPALALIFASTAVVFCILPGLPIRLHKGINTWWRRHFYIAAIMVIAGLLMSALSLLPSMMQTVTYNFEGAESQQTVPHQFLSITGWYLVAFGALHQYPPKVLQDRLERFFEKLK
jgi:hypothetical protein